MTGESFEFVKKVFNGTARKLSRLARDLASDVSETKLAGAAVQSVDSKRQWMFVCGSVQFHCTDSGAPSGLSRVVCGAHLRLPGPRPPS